MIRGIIADLLRDLTDLQAGVNQVIRGVRQAEPLDQLRKGVPCVLLDQRAQMRLAVVKQLRQGGQGESLIIMLNILEHQRKIRAHLIIIKLDGLAVIPQHRREKQIDAADAAAVAVHVVSAGFDHHHVDAALEAGIVFGKKEQIIGMLLPLEDRAEKIGQQILAGHEGKENGIKGALPDADREHGGIVLNEKIVPRRRGDDADLAFSHNPFFLFKNELPPAGYHIIYLKIVMTVKMRPGVPRMADHINVPRIGNHIRFQDSGADPGGNIGRDIQRKAVHQPVKLLIAEDGGIICDFRKHNIFMQKIFTIKILAHFRKLHAAASAFVKGFHVSLKFTIRNVVGHSLLLSFCADAYKIIA